MVNRSKAVIAQFASKLPNHCERSDDSGDLRVWITSPLARFAMMVALVFVKKDAPGNRFTSSSRYIVMMS